MVEVFCTEYNTNDIERIVVNESAQLKVIPIYYYLILFRLITFFIQSIMQVQLFLQDNLVAHFYFLALCFKC